ncbi:MAG: DUF2868 domain-containing protein [Verrucomicrobiales bacterium]
MAHSGFVRQVEDMDRAWSVGELLAFESANQAENSGVTRAERELVAEAVAGLEGQAAQRRRGFLVWLRSRLAGGWGSGVELVERGDLAWSLAAWILLLLGGLAGAGVLAGVFERESSSLHLFALLGATVGWQFVLYLAALLAWPFRGRLGGLFSLVERGVLALVGRLSGDRRARQLWGDVRRSGALYGRVLQWGVLRMSQLAMVACHVVLVVSFWWLLAGREVKIYWTSTFAGTESVLVNGASLLALPWAWAWPEAAPGAAEVEASQVSLGAGDLAAVPTEAWWPFVVMVLLVWGLLPRLIFFLAAWRGERRALRNLAFEGRDHGRLWRELQAEPAAGVSVEVREAGDGALLVDWGGSGVTVEELRGTCLRDLRLNPVGVLRVGYLDAEKEAASWRELAERLAEPELRAVVFCVEGWELVPGEVERALVKLREVAADLERVVLFVMGEARDGRRVAPEPTAWRSWQDFIDGLAVLREGAGFDLELRAIRGAESDLKGLADE